MTGRHTTNNLRQRRVRLWTRAAAASCLLAAALLASFVQSQGIGLGVTADFPGVGSLRVDPVEIHFELNEEQYPPPEFPWYYSPRHENPDWDGVIHLDVNANLGSWLVTAEFHGLVNEQENLLLPASQLQYRVDEAGQWESFELGSTTLLIGVPGQFDAATESHEVQLRLEVTGRETPGSYTGTLLFTLASNL